uniref:ATP-dependent DNA helicase n=1 Tax=Cyprinus carpio carpio TaxID=630221 RepID=A0A9J7Y7T4_CYPCA
MPRKGRRSRAQKVRWTKLDLTGQTSISKGVAQVSDGQQYEDGDNTSRILSVQASHCQSDARYDVFSRNHQCTCVALTFLAYHSEGTSFEQPDLDRVLEEGDALYVGIKMQLIAEGRFRQDLLSMAEVPVSISTSNHNYSVQKSEVVMGYLRDRGTSEMEAWWLPLHERLQCLSTHVSHALLIVSPECFAVFRDRSGRYGFFDSHSRTAEGLPHPTGDGTAVMLTFTNLHDMTNRLLELFWNRGPQACYEFMAVSFEMEQQSEEPCSSLACVSPSEVTSPLPKTQTTADIRIPENLVQTDYKNKSVIKVLKTNKQRRRKEMRKIVYEKQDAGLEGTSLHFEVRKQKRREYEREKYATNFQFRMKKKEITKKKYDQDPFARHKKMEYITRRYNKDVLFQKKQKGYIIKRYNTDALFQRKMKNYMFRRYKTDDLFQKKKKDYMVRRYHTDAIFQKKMKDYMARRYASDSEFRSHHILRCTLQKKQKCLSDPGFHILHKLRCALRIKRKYRPYIRFSQETPNSVATNVPVSYSIMQKAISAFRCQILHGPTYICTVCHRTLFPNQVKMCNRTRYVKNVHITASCLTGKYVHACDSACSVSCAVPEERRQEWICHTCDSHLKRGSMPSIAVANRLELPPIPAELLELNVLERQLIAKIVPFAKIVALPKGQQRSVYGAVVCVPSEVEKTVNCLPRPNSESQLLQVKLKRHIKFRGYQHFHTVNMHNVLAALAKLKAMHSEYRDILISDAATFEFLSDDELDDTEEKQEVGISEQDDQNVSTEEKDELRPGLTLDTCMQPLDIGQDLLSYGEGIFSIAPAQGKKPVGFFKVPKLEAMAFPVQFPTGQNTVDEARQVALSPSMYFNARLFCVDTRFAKDQSYLFFAQFVTETHMARNSMSIQLRKGKPVTKDGRRISNKLLQDDLEVERLVHSRDATRFMQPLRGTPSYWEKTLRDLQAMIRQLGNPTFFCTFSAAEMRWPEVITAIKAQQGEEVVFSELDWTTKCEILRSNPVTVMRMFEKRVDALMTHLLLSPAQPIGEVEDYFYRVEFQARGSPHIHLLAWVKGAPEFENQSDQVVCDFIDRYITCQLPDPTTDPELHKIVTEVQLHSRKHSKSCKKGNVLCRYGFPKLPMSSTTITRPRPQRPEEDQNEDQNHPEKKTARQDAVRKAMNEARTKLKPLWDLLNDPQASFDNLSDLLTKCNLSMDDYCKYAEALSTSNVILLKRDPKEAWVNGYNPDLLRAWNANMDIQFVLDSFSCIMYMLSYISKPEHEMNDFLKTVIKGVRETNVNEEDEMKQIMQAYSKHRQVSAQESVARTCSLPMKKCSRSVVFIPTDDDALKMSLPRSVLHSKDPDSEDVWMSGMIDKYRARPQTPEFEKMCLADFVSNYRVVYGRQTKGKNVLPLLNDMGFIQKRTVGKAAIIRYARFSEEKQPEKFCGTLVKLYVPHRFSGQLKPQRYPTYQEFYKNAFVELPAHPGLLMPVLGLVKAQQQKFEKHSKKVDEAFEQLQREGPSENAWSAFAPEIDVDRMECIAEQQDVDPEEDEQDDVPEYQILREDGDGVVPQIEAPQMTNEFLRKMFRSLNETQAAIFYTVRQWCQKRVWGHNPEQFFYFLSGGAGCGKSHVIKCIHSEATKILRQLPRLREEGDLSVPTVLLSAFTGTAAFNISGKTLHSLLKLPRSLKPPYQGLGNALDEVRAGLRDVEILIIDEISMVSKDLFTYVNWRFQQIKGSKKPFGGISCLVVGDYYQLPPLGKAKPLCVYEEDVLDFWKDHFQIITLTEIMRQKEDLAFAELLNRLRVKQKTEALREDDRALLFQAVKKPEDCPRDALHIFATNKEVDKYNTETVQALFTDIITIDAEDYRKDPKTGRMKILNKPATGKKDDLLDTMQVAVGVRVMVTRNLDVEDGIVNGCFGTIANIVTKTKDGIATVQMLGLQLDNPNAGQKHRKKVRGEEDVLVYIERSEESLRKGAVRRQFPIKLAYACTAHKVQGMTMQSAVVSLKKIFEPGMAYVALSRTTSLQGLHITDFDDKKIYADPEITASLQSMRRARVEDITPLLKHVKENRQEQTLTIIHHNTEGLASHMEDIRCHHELQLADVLCLTETHLTGSCTSDLQLKGHNLFTRNRHVSYSTHQELGNKNGGGVTIYCKEHIPAQPRQYIQNVTDLEFVVIKLDSPIKAAVVAVYRPPQYNIGDFLTNLKSMLDYLDLAHNDLVIICGDFNEDLLHPGKKPILELFQARGYTQLITTATTEKHTLLDHIYISNPDLCHQSGVLQSYHSYHNPVYCVLRFT